MAEDSELWDAICDGPFVPMKTVGEGTVTIPKTRKKYNDADRKAIEKNFRAKKILSAKEIWEALQTAHDGTTLVKQCKIDMLTTEYELFKMKEDESIQDMHTRFTSIINELHSLGEIIPRNKLVRKILSVLPGSWESKANAITEAKDLQKLTIDELIGNLNTYEMKRKKDLERREPKKENNLVLEAANKDSSSDDSDMEYLTRRFQKMIRKNGGFQRKEVPAGISKKMIAAIGDHYKTNTKKATKKNQVPDRKFKKRDDANNMLKQALVDWGNSSNESEGENMMVDDNRSSEYELIFALMAKSNDNEDKEEDENSLVEEIGGIEQEKDYMGVSIVDLEETIESIKKEKEVLTKSNANIEHERDDLLVVVVNLKETIGELKMKSRPENSQKGKAVASEAHIKLESELNSVKSSLCAELERNKQVQEELGRVKSDLEKSLKWTWSSDAITAFYTNNGGNRKEIRFQMKKTPYNPYSKYVIVPDNWLCTHCGNTRHFKENCKVRIQSL
uniref:Liprin-alpha-2-like n=1 Tax=Nicotiana sylvestris TaxID=4096 RepID=A0A1U7XUI9_NICSY|nr:PREDICTED: liprin-alpha-2-like [Nicotiana sylvestris]